MSDIPLVSAESGATLTDEQSEWIALCERLQQRLDGRVRQPEFEALLLDSVQAHYGTVGRDYIETRLKMATTLEIALLDLDEESDDGREPRVGNA